MTKRPLSEVLQVLESDQDIELPMNPEYYQNLHDKIMKAVERVDGASTAWLERSGPRPKSRPKAPSWRGLADVPKPVQLDPKLNS